MKRNILSLTELAKGRIQSLLLSSPQHVGLFLGVKQGGCAGMEYDIRLIESAPPNCDEIVVEGITFFIPKECLLFILGTVIDYETTPIRTGFIFTNPNQVSACGCGMSVMLKPSRES